MKILLSILMIFTILPLQSCGGITPDEEQSFPQTNEYTRRDKRGKVTGEGFNLFEYGEKESSSNSGIGVNRFLWRAALDVISFSPLASTDPIGGVIITDWYEDPAALGQKFKINVMILGTELRTDGLRVSVFKKQKDAENKWRDIPTSRQTNRDLEDKILTRARELKIKSVQR